MASQNRDFLETERAALTLGRVLTVLDQESLHLFDEGKSRNEQGF